MALATRQIVSPVLSHFPSQSTTPTQYQRPLWSSRSTPFTALFGTSHTLPPLRRTRWETAEHGGFVKCRREET